MVFRAPGPAAVCAGGRRSSCLLFVAPTDLRPPRRHPPAPRQVPPACCLWPRWCSGCRRARPPARLGDLTSFVAAPRSPPVPSGPSGTLHTGAACRCVLSGHAPPPTGTAAGPSGLLLVAPMVFRVPSGPAAREARRPHVVRRRASKPARALRSLRHPPHRRGLSLCVTRLGPALAPQALLWRSRTSLLSSSISHAIPPRLFQTMNLQRWNCNVFRYC